MEQGQIRSCLEAVPRVRAEGGRRLAFLVNFSFHDWYRAMIPFMQGRAAQYGAQLEVLDSRQDPELQAAQLKELIVQGVDGVIIAPVRETGLEELVRRAVEAGVRVVCESSLIAGAQALVATCDYDMGFALGRYAAERLLDPGEAAYVLDITYPALDSVLLRSEGFWEGISSRADRCELVARVDGRAEVSASRAVATDVLRRRPEVNVVFGMDDESAAGAAEALGALGRTHVPVVGCGLSGPLGRAALVAPEHPYRAAAAMFPENVGVCCVDEAVRADVEPGTFRRVITPLAIVDGQTVANWYDVAGTTWVPRLAAIRAIPVPERCGRDVPQRRGGEPR